MTVPPDPKQRSSETLSRRAYDTLEARIVTCELQPGRLLSILDLQTATGLGRTPIHHAVNRLAADTLILVRPRHGLQVAPIDLALPNVVAAGGSWLAPATDIQDGNWAAITARAVRSAALVASARRP